MEKSIDDRAKHFKKLFKSIGERYEKERFLQSLGTRYESWIEINTVMSTLKRLKSDQNNRVLEIGIGTARISREIVRHGHKIIGIDIIPAMLKHSSEVLHQQDHGQECDFVLSSMSHLPFKEGRFDAVICIRTLKYAAHPSKVLQEAHRVLRNRGIFVVEFPNIKTYYSFLIWLDKLTGKRKLRVKYFVLDEMVKNVKATGFDILRIKETLRLPRSFYKNVYRKAVLKTAIYIEQALSRLLPQTILTRSFIMACSRIRKK